MPLLSRITVYPIKSLDGHDLSASAVLPNGALAHDRRYAFVDGLGRSVNGKRYAELHSIRATYTDDLQHVELSCENETASFTIASEHEQLAAWIGEALGIRCRLTENSDGGFPDDVESPGPTLVSTSTLETVANWFDGLDLAESRRRFRFNLEVAEAPAFWEDGLVAGAHKVRRFRIGDLVWQGCGVCQRCNVPTRDSADGTVTAGFVRKFVQRRADVLPDWAARERFDHFYRLGVNTRLESDDIGSVLHIGDVVELIS